jgi:hypothetical protein
MKSYDIYTSADSCPLLLFEKVAETGNVLLLSSNNHTFEECSAAWEKINDELMKASPPSPSLRSAIESKVQALECFAAAYLHGQKWQLAMAKHTLASLPDQTAQPTASVHEVCAKLSKRLGFLLSPQNLTVMEYVFYLKA